VSFNALLCGKRSDAMHYKFLVFALIVTTSAVGDNPESAGKRFSDMSFSEALSLSFFETTGGAIIHLESIDGDDATILRNRLKSDYTKRVFIFWKLKQRDQLGNLSIIQRDIESYIGIPPMEDWEELDDPLGWLKPLSVDSKVKLHHLPGYAKGEYKDDLPLFRKFIDSLNRAR
jgi:hypothetical protein